MAHTHLNPPLPPKNRTDGDWGRDMYPVSWWNDRYSMHPEPTEYLDDYHGFQSVLESVTQGDKNVEVLDAGCGNSRIAENLYDNGYHKIISIDTSKVVIEQMRERHKKKPGMTFDVLDATNMSSIQNHSLDVVIDKALMDTMIENKNPFLNTFLYLQEVDRVLRPGGTFLCCSVRAMKIIEPFEFPHIEFECEEKEMLSPFGTRQPYYVYICKKRNQSLGHTRLWPEVLKTLAACRSEKEICLTVIDAYSAKNPLAWARLALQGGGWVHNRPWTPSMCLRISLFIASNNPGAWNSLGRYGGGEVASKMYSAKECFEKALSFDLHEAAAWRNLGQFGGGFVNGKNYSIKECYENALSGNRIRESRFNAYLWKELGKMGGAQVDDLPYPPKKCLELAVSWDVNEAEAWMLLASLGGGSYANIDWSRMECYNFGLISEGLDVELEGLIWCKVGSMGGGELRLRDDEYIRMYTEKECFENALSSGVPDERERSELWSRLGTLGGNAHVDGLVVSQVQCFICSLVLNPAQAEGWYHLGRLGGGNVNGSNYSAQECLQKYLESETKNERNAMDSWMRVSHQGAQIKGQWYSRKDCLEKASSINRALASGAWERAVASDENNPEENPEMWLKLGRNGGGAVNYSQSACLEKALSLNPASAEAWQFLGVAGGGKVCGLEYSAKDCYRYALTLDPALEAAWSKLAVNGGGYVNGTFHSAEKCLGTYKSLSVVKHANMTQDSSRTVPANDPGRRIVPVEDHTPFAMLYFGDEESPDAERLQLCKWAIEDENPGREQVAQELEELLENGDDEDETDEQEEEPHKQEEQEEQEEHEEVPQSWLAWANRPCARRTESQEIRGATGARGTRRNPRRKSFFRREIQDYEQEIHR
eukprot:gnl/MRDRNA2_/MRDRNA2_70228_c0_seq1.p1 gnl/MRDRNA2_/MRDRNA2_70228_c0~~gnl/MRDRNA2_/MRDRNA2_70228_c0_seq1.p1  ORF type:complete len:890 (-),score=131.44 gnl/MRDRNA2_/MRDRNA2_70228_c0_seq1:97-2733(-)